jgi:DNA-binding NarL/FixJ family response regulator
MSRLQIYLVEDSALIRDSLVATLQELLPVDVLGSAPDEAGAVAWLNQPGQRADLLIVDIFLRPGGSGLGVLQAARRLALPPGLVVLSNYASADMRQRCLALGADRVFDKSHEIDALLAYCGGLAAQAAVAGAGLPAGGTH